jgi:hypothetical protein
VDESGTHQSGEHSGTRHPRKEVNGEAGVAKSATGVVIRHETSETQPDAVEVKSEGTQMENEGKAAHG